MIKLAFAMGLITLCIVIIYALIVVALKEINKPTKQNKNNGTKQ